MTGAAVPRPAELVRPGRDPARCECFTCGTSGRYGSRAQLREHGPDRCGSCGGPLLPSSADDCRDLTPDYLEAHPVWRERADAAERSNVGRSREHLHGSTGARGYCAACGRLAPEGSDPDYFYCRGCWHVNDHGTVFKASPFSPEVERANGLVQRRKVAPTPPRARAAWNNRKPVDLPF